MAYDNTKFDLAFDKWLEQNVSTGFGEHYAGELLEDFEEFLRETRMLKRSPGRVVFGRRLAHKGFEKRKKNGLTYWSGLELKHPRQVDPLRFAQASTKERMKEAAFEREMVRRREELARSPDARAAELERFQSELDEEERRHRELEDAEAQGL